MRSALALSVLLLLLPSSLSEDDPAQLHNSSATIKPTTAVKQDLPTVSSTTSTTVTTGSATPKLVTDPTSIDPRVTDPAQGKSPPTTKDPVVYSTTAQQRPTTLSTGLSEKLNKDSPTITASGFHDSKTSSLFHVVPTSTEATSQQDRIKEITISGGQTTTNSMTTPGSIQSAHQSTDPVSTLKPTPAASAPNTGSPSQWTDVTSVTSANSLKGHHSPATVSSSSGSVTSPGFTSSTQGIPITPTPLGASQDTQQNSSQVPFSPDLPSAMMPQSTSTLVETGSMPAFLGPTRSSTDLAPTTTQGPTTPSPTWTLGRNKVKCDPAIKPSEDLLILNLTAASFCAGSPPDDRLVTLLCQSVKTSFNPAQDECTVQVAPVLESQAVAVKGITIETKLLPKDVYERLKDKWGDLREAGVSDMQLGNEGPPDDAEDHFSMPLIITIVCMASFLLLVAALYGCCHQRLSQRKDQQRLTEELQTVENGYHDNPTLEVMETTSEMQEKKVVNLNGELGDSWIVPLDNLTKDDLDEEEDTHL